MGRPIFWRPSRSVQLAFLMSFTGFGNTLLDCFTLQAPLFLPSCFLLQQMNRFRGKIEISGRRGLTRLSACQLLAHAQDFQRKESPWVADFAEWVFLPLIQSRAESASEHFNIALRDRETMRNVSKRCLNREGFDEAFEIIWLTISGDSPSEKLASYPDC